MEVTPDLIPGDYTDPYKNMTPKEKVRIVEEHEYKVLRRVIIWFIILFTIILIFFWALGWINSYQEGYVNRFESAGFL